MSKNSAQPNIFRCPVCNDGLPYGQDYLPRHFRIKHNREVTATDCARMLAEGMSKFPSETIKLRPPALKLPTRKPIRMDKGTFCDLCYSFSPSWRYENTNRGQVDLCDMCLNRLKPKSKVDVLDAKGFIAHGNYGG